MTRTPFQEAYNHLFNVTNKALRCSALLADAVNQADLTEIAEKLSEVSAGLVVFDEMLIGTADDGARARARLEHAACQLKEALKTPFQAKKRDLLLNETMRQLAGMAAGIWHA